MDTPEKVSPAELAVRKYLEGRCSPLDMLIVMGREEDKAIIVQSALSIPKDYLDELAVRIQGLPADDEGWGTLTTHSWDSHVRIVQLRHTVETLRESGF